MREGSYEPNVWHVVFTRRDNRFFFDRLSPPGFRHCFAFGYCRHAKAWVVYDASLTGTELKVIPQGEAMAEFWTSMLEAGATIVRVRGEPSKPMASRMVLYCVTAVKHLIGARSGALRPIGLFRDLVRQGGEITFWKGQLYEGQGA